MTTASDDNTVAARLRIVDEHVGLENMHDLDGIIATFGETARYDDEPWNAHYLGLAQVRSFYDQLLRALPDLHIDVQRRHASPDAVILEVIIRGTHLGAWRGLPATGGEIAFPLCSIYTFDARNRIAGEKIYYDRATVLRQLGVFHDPESLPGRITTVLAHPVTMARVIAHASWRRGRARREIG
jgi:steroid delta-isomerase-like uncharacterized protein